MNKKNYINIIIPCYNEEKNILQLYRELVLNLNNLFLSYRIIYVNDNSNDSSEEIFNKIKINDKSVHIINNNKRMGQSYSIYKGAQICDSKFFFTIDGDGQNNPNDLKNFLKFIDTDYDLIYGIRYKRKDNIVKKIASILANKIRSFILNDGCLDTGCGLKLFKTSSFNNINFFDGYHRFFPALFIGKNFKVKGIKVDHRYRYMGVSKYGVVKRGIKGSVDLIRVLFINFSNK